MRTDNAGMMFQVAIEIAHTCVCLSFLKDSFLRDPRTLEKASVDEKEVQYMPTIT